MADTDYESLMNGKSIGRIGSYFYIKQMEVFDCMEYLKHLKYSSTLRGFGTFFSKNLIN